MDIESLREYCLKKKAAKETFPFGDSTLVFKVKGKVFLLASLDASPLRFNVKADPEIIDDLREQYEDVLPGYHMNKRHWNTIVVTGRMSEKVLKQMIDDSYRLVVKSLSQKDQKGLT
ncbi:MAG: MmcQ/YjbR family DNA-binding protein [Bacteroidetes bacterium]|nr:MmcQ/YjbR family DNA-binding protein [Bacteroidota bacterium]